MSWKPSALTRYLQLARRRPSKSSTAGLLVAIFLVLRLNNQRLRRSIRGLIMPAKPPSFPGFRPLSDQVFVRDADPEAAAAAPPGHPDVVMIYGWGDGLPKHVAKYAEGFRALYPGAKQVAVLSPIAKAMFSDLARRTEFMVPVVREVFPRGPDAHDAPRSVLVHAMSNTGAVNFASTLNAFRDMYARPLPHRLLSLDSTPGSTDLTWTNLERWSRAMAYGLSQLVPVPFVATQTVCAVFLYVSGTLGHLLGRESPGAWSRKAALDPSFETPDARKLYLYSKEDDLISWEDIEIDVADNRAAGWAADVEVFDGSTHVGHMRMHGPQYWGAIQAAWDKAVEAVPEAAVKAVPEAAVEAAAATPESLTGSETERDRETL